MLIQNFTVVWSAQDLIFGAVERIEAETGNAAAIAVVRRAWAYGYTNVMVLAVFEGHLQDARTAHGN